MDRLILIPVRGRDRVEDILPYLDDIAQPRTKITFLVHLGTRRFRHQLDKLFSIQSDATPGRHIAAMACAEEATKNHDLADQIREIRGRLQDVEVELKFYAGSLRPLADQLAQEKCHLIVMLRPASNPVVRWLYKILYAGSFPKHLVTTPVLLCHLGSRAR